MFTKAAHIKPTTSKGHHPAFNRVQQHNDSFIPSIQPKLQVDAPTSRYEVEADKMADHVVSSSAFIQPTNFVSTAPVQTSPEPSGTAGPELDAGELADQLLPPMPGEDSKVKNDDAEPETNVEEEKKDKKEPETVEKEVKAPSADSKSKKEGGGAPAGEEKEEEPKASEEKGEEVSAEDAAAFASEPKLDPVSPIAIIPELTTQFVQAKLEESPQLEEEQEGKEESAEGNIHTKLFDQEGGATKDNLLQRSGNGAPEVSSKTEHGIASTKTGGQSLDGHTQQFMESQFQADFSDVKIHTDNSSVDLNNQLRAKAFTHENHVYFNEGQYKPESNEGKHLLAHELTHVVQQDSSIQRKPQISPAPAPKVQRLGLSDALDYFADKANHIPGFRMFTIILGVNPINMSSVDPSAANIMRAIVEFLPGGFLITQALDNHGVFDKASVWFKEQVDSLGISGSSIKRSVTKFLDGLGWSDIFDLGGVWRDAKAIFTVPIKRLISFAKGLVSKVIEMVKSAILRPLASLAEGTDAYDLLRLVIGSDPITGDPYPPTAENLIGGFMKLIGQEEIWKNIQEGNAIEKAYTWFQGAMSGLLSFVTSIPTTIVDTLTSLTWKDIVLLPKAFVKVGKVFLNVAGKFLTWAGGTVLSLLEIIFTVVAPGAVPWIKKAGAGFNSIIENPVGFIGNLIKAVKVGFESFAANIGKHLKAAMLNWLLGSLAGAGIYIPTGLNFQEIIKFVMSVLGLSWANVRIKLVKHLGEPAVKALEVGFELVTLLVTKGPMAMWERIMEHISDLKTMVMGEITSWVVTKVVTKAITKLISSLNPAGAVIQAILFIYDTVTFLIDKIKKIASVGFAVLDSIVSIANGVIGEAAKKVEKTFAGMLVLAINFLAHFLGLGKVSKKIVEIVKKLQEKVDKALDKAIEYVVTAAKNFLKGIFGLGGKKDSPLKDDGEIGNKVSFSGGNEGHKLWIDQSSITVMVASTPIDVKAKLAEWKGLLASMDGEKKKEGQKLLANAEPALTKTNKEAKETKAATDKAKTNASPQTVEAVNTNDDETEAAEQALAAVLAPLFDFFEPDKQLKKKYAGEIGKSHLNIVPKINAEIDSNADELKTVPNWEAFKEILKSKALKPEQSKPVDLGHDYGKSVKGSEGMSGLDAAIADSGKTEKELLGDETKDKFIDKRRGAIHAGSGGNAAQILEIARNYIFNNSLASLLKGAFQNFFKNSLTGSKEHNKFYPVNIVEEPANGGVKKITYSYAEGSQSFTVFVNASGYPIFVDADNLEFHDLGRGRTQNPDGKVIGKGMDSAHVIANMFGGSGYKKAHNIVATSAYYNQGAMLDTELEIRKWLKGFSSLDKFKLKITVKYYGENDSVELKEIKNAITSKTKDDDERRSLNDGELDKRVKSILGKTDQPRVKNLVYQAFAFDSTNTLLNNKSFTIGEGDVLFGTG